MGGNDFLTYDPAKKLVYVSHGSAVAIIDPATKMEVLPALTGANIKGVHGIALNKDGTLAFISSGMGSKAVKVDLATKMEVVAIATGANPDHILYESFSDKIVSFNNGGHDANVIDITAGTIIQTLPLPGAAEVGVTDGAGNVWVNAGSSVQQLLVPATGMWTLGKVWDIGCDATGLALDIAGKRLFSSCDGAMVVSNAETGAKVIEVPTAGGADGAAYDAATKMVFTTNGDGSMAAIQQMTPDTYMLLEEIPTGMNCKTAAYDPIGHRVFTSCNHMGALSVAIVGKPGGVVGAGGAGGAGGEPMGGAGGEEPGMAGSTGLPAGGSGGASGGSGPVVPPPSTGGVTGGTPGAAGAPTSGAGAPGQAVDTGGDSGGCSVQAQSRDNAGHGGTWLAALGALAVAMIRRRRDTAG
jgi:MYXO-CTERM domain-containing protein